MRSSGMMINLAAAAALTFAAGSLWHAYKVRFADETEHVSEDRAPGDAAAPPVAGEPEKPAAAAPPAASETPEVASAKVEPTPPVAPTPVSTPAVAVPTEQAPVAPAPAIETAKTAPTPTPVPSPARFSLRDPRAIPANAVAPEPAARAAPPLPAAANSDPQPSTVLPMLSDRRSLTERGPTVAPTQTRDQAAHISASLLRDPRQIVGLNVPDQRRASVPSPDLAARPATPVIEPQPAPVNAPMPAPAGSCGPHAVATEAREGGMMRVGITSACRAGQDVHLAYGGAVLVRRLDPSGKLEFLLDCFAGAASELLVTFADGQSEKRPVVAKGLDKVSKVAVIWSAPVNLDLHAFEYSAGFGKAGHIWERAASTLVTAREITLAGRRGRGYLSSSDDGRSLGDKIEVYTFLHHDEQAAGVVAMGLDYETRGENPAGMTCGNGSLAEVRYLVVTLGRRGQTARENGILSAAPCGARIASQARFDPFLLPAVRVQK